MRFFRIFVVFPVHSQEKMTKWCCVPFLFLFFRVYKSNIVIRIVLLVHQPLKPSLRQALDAYSGLIPTLSLTPPSYQILENTLPRRHTCGSTLGQGAHAPRFTFAPDSKASWKNVGLEGAHIFQFRRMDKMDSMTKGLMRQSP